MKNTYLKGKQMYLVSFMALSTICGCALFAPTVSSYDQYAYAQTTALKVDALNLMDSAVDNYQSHARAIATVKTNVQKLYEYEKNLPKNDFTLKLWQVLTDTTGHLWGGFIVKWRNDKTLSKVYVEDKKKQISFAFDQITELESKKIKSSEIKN